RPPTPALLPYTTLFRSSLFYMSGYKPDLIERWKHDPGVRHFDLQRHLDRYASSKPWGLARRLDCDLWFFDTFYFQHNDDAPRAEDRKSTRLNSSHVKIS